MQWDTEDFRLPGEQIHTRRRLNEGTLFHNTIAWCDTTHSSSQRRGLKQNSCQHCGQAWDVRAEFWGEVCTEYHLKHTHTASDCGPRRWYLPTNALMGLWEKASGYQTTQWLEGHNLSFRDALLQWCVTRSTSGRNVTTTLEHLRNDRTSIYSLNTPPKKRILFVFSFSKCHHQWLKWSKWTIGNLVIAALQNTNFDI